VEEFGLKSLCTKTANPRTTPAIRHEVAAPDNQLSTWSKLKLKRSARFSCSQAYFIPSVSLEASKRWQQKNGLEDAEGLWLAGRLIVGLKVP
jgi:hypothetical protein